MTYEQFKKSALEKKTQTNNISDAYKKFKENALNPTQKEETQTTTMPKFKTLEEAQAYAKANNINAVNTGAKIPNLVGNDTSPFKTTIVSDHKDLSEEELKEALESYDKGKFASNKHLGELQIEYNDAMNKYFESQNQKDLEKAQEILAEIERYQKYATNVGKGNWITKDFAQYLPQLVGQQVAGAGGAVVGAGTGAGIGAGIGSVVPGAGTAVGAGTGAIWGAKAGYVGGIAKWSYDQMRGSAYASLLELGARSGLTAEEQKYFNEVAREIASDTAFWQSVVESGEAVLDLATMGGFSKLFTTGAKTATQVTVKKMLAEALKAYGINILSEGAEEGIQERIAIEKEKEALKKVGIEYTGTKEEESARVKEAVEGGMKIATVSGGLNAGGSVAVNTIKNVQANKQNTVQPTNNQVQQIPTNQQKEWKPSNQVATQSTNTEMTKLNKNDQVTENVQNTAESAENVQTSTENAQITNKNALKNEKTVQTNIGNIPIAEYRDIMAQQAGFDNYADMRKQGYKLGNEYDIDVGNVPENQKTVKKEEKTTTYSPIEDIDKHKQQQLDIILKENPVDVNLSEHTWIRNIEDIKAFEEALQEDLDGEIQSLTPDVSAEMVKKMIETGKAIVYSSHPIKQGTFVTPSKVEAQTYAGSGKIYSKEVELKDVDWIDSLQGQYAKIESLDTKFFRSEDAKLFDAILEKLNKQEIIETEKKLLEDKYGEEAFDMDWQDYVGEVEDQAIKIVFDRYVDSKEGIEFVENYRKQEANKKKQEKISNESEIKENSTGIDKNQTPVYNQVRGDKNDRNGNEKTVLGVKDWIIEKTERQRKDAETLVKRIKNEIVPTPQKQEIIEFGKIFGLKIVAFQNDDISSFTAQDGIYISIGQAESVGYKAVLNHELVEDMLLNHTKIVIEDFSKIIHSISNNAKAINKLFNEYKDLLSNKQKRDIAKDLKNFAKEILCDLNTTDINDKDAQYLKKVYIDALGEKFYNDTIVTIKKHIELIYKKNSNEQGSFSLADKLKGLNVELDYAELKYKEYAKSLQYTEKARDGFDKWDAERKRLRNEIEKLEAKNKTEKIDDFGEKIGGARKDVWQGTKKHFTREVIHNYTINKDIIETEDGKTEEVYSVAFKGNVLKGDFKSEADAEKFLEEFKTNINNNRARVEEGYAYDKEGNKHKRYIVKIIEPKTLKSRDTGKSFSTREEAESYAMALSMYLAEHGKNLFRPQIQKVTRINPNNANSVNATGQEILDKFNFRGGEFGNWVNNEERQKFLNYGYDSLTDLATALDIIPSDLGFNGKMAIAFGARGHGLSGASAHFEPVKKVFNMTKLKGAGSVAHEMGHALDNYLSQLSGYDSDGLLSIHKMYRNLPESVTKAYRELLDNIEYSFSTNEEEIAKKNALFEKNRKSSIEYNLKYYDDVFDGKAKKYKRVKGEYKNIPIEVTAEQKKEYEKIRKILIEGKLKDKRDYKQISRSKFEVIYDKPLEDLKTLIKAVTNRKIDDDTVYSLYRSGVPAKQVAFVRSESAFSKSARELDKLMGRASTYFALREEMLARSFEAFVHDELKKKGITNDYLVHSVNNDRYGLFNPFPAGEERANINKSWRALINAMKEENIFHDTDGKVKKVKATAKPKLDEDSQIKLSRKDDGVQDSYKTNAERMSALIEQKIRAIESGKVSREENLGTISRKEIRQKIEKYLGRPIRTGGFRQKAYAVYNSAIQSIRTKQLTDIESIIHELGHHVDLAQLNVTPTKDTLAWKKQHKELAREMNNLCERQFGDVYNNTPKIKLQEGFAEFTRRYIVDTENAIKQYPYLADFITEARESNVELDQLFTDLINDVKAYINMRPEERIMSNVSINEDEKKNFTLGKFIDRLMFEIYDDNWYLKKASDTLAKRTGLRNRHELKPSEDPYVLFRLVNSGSDQTTNMLNKGIRDWDTDEKITQGFASVLEPISKAEDMMKLRALLIAQRNRDYVKKGQQTGLRKEDAIATTNLLEKDEKIKKTADNFRKENNGILEYARREGLFTAKQIEDIEKLNENYIAMNRVMDNEGKIISASTKGAKVGKTVYKTTGSEREIIDPIESTIVNASRIIRQVENNKVLKSLVNLGRKSNQYADLFEIVPPPMEYKGSVELSKFEKALSQQGIDTSDLNLEEVYNVFNMKLADDKNKIMSYIDDGKRVFVQFYDEDLYNVLKGMNSQNMNIVEKFMNWANMPLRYGATMANAEFAVPNAISDSQQAFLYSDTVFIPLVDNILGIVNTLAGRDNVFSRILSQVPIFQEYVEAQKEFYNLYQQSGASQSGRFSTYRAKIRDNATDIYSKNKKVLFGKKDPKTGKYKLNSTKYKAFLDLTSMLIDKTLNLLTYTSELTEESTRFQNFRKETKLYRKKGMSNRDIRLKTALNAKDITQDFGRAGKTTRVINKFIPFSSARVGSVYRFGESVHAHPFKTSLKLGIMIAFALALKEYTEEKENKHVEEMTDQKKKDNFVIAYDSTSEPLTIKKAQGTARSFINLAEYLYDLSNDKIPKGEEGERLADWVKDTLFDMLPADDLGNAVPQIIKPLLENMLNKDFYYKTDLVSEYLKGDTKPADQYNEYTSELAIMLGGALNVSPIYIDNIFEGYLAGLGTQFLDLADKFLDVQDSGEQPAKNKSEQFILKRFFASGYKSGVSLDEVYELASELEIKKNYSEATPEELEQLKQLNYAKDTLKLLNKDIKTTRNSLQLNAEQKKNKINELQELRTDTARYYLGKDLINPSNADKIKLYEYYPAQTTYKYKVNSMKTVEVEYTEADMKEYAQIAKDEYEKLLSTEEKKRSYKEMNESEKLKKKESLLTKAKGTAQDTVSEKIYKRSR